jgi:hypothetical protein
MDGTTDILDDGAATARRCAGAVHSRGSVINDTQIDHAG